MHGYSMDFSGLRSHHKNDTAAAPPPELLAFMSVALAPELFFYASDFWSFSHINILLTWCASS